MIVNRSSSTPQSSLIRYQESSLAEASSAALTAMQHMHKREVTRGIIADIASNIPMSGSFDLYMNVRWRQHDDGESCEVVVRKRDY